MRLLIAAGAKPASSQLIATFIHTARSAGAPEECVALLEGREVPDPAVVFQEGDNTAAHLEWATLLTNICTTGGEPVSALAVRLCPLAARRPHPDRARMSLLTHLCMKSEAECVRLPRGARVAARGGRRAAAVVLASRRVRRHPECAALLIAARAVAMSIGAAARLCSRRATPTTRAASSSAAATRARASSSAPTARSRRARAPTLAASNDYCFALTPSSTTTARW